MAESKIKRALILTICLFCVLASACGRHGGAADPGQWGYDCVVTYNALGGLVNAREVRTTYYLPNSYVFKPSGSSNMLIEPTRDGYILAGWYTAKSDRAAGSAEDYAFLAADRWDFQLDRVQGDMTLYARWIPRAKVNYIDAATGAVIFSKNITTDSPIQPLSGSVVELNAPGGATFEGYYEDAACTKEYDFAAYVHVDPTPTEAQLYAKLYEMFPQYLEKIDYVAPEEDEVDPNADTSWLFLNKLGYNLTTTDEAARAELRAAKDQIIEEAVEAYLVNTANRVVYMKFTQGNYIVVNDAGDLKMGTKYGFFSEDAKGNPIDGYIINADIDLAGVTFVTSESFSGVINGNGHKLMNLKVAVSGKKIDADKEKIVGLTALMDGATINDLTIENAALSIEVMKGIKVTGGLLAANAKNVTLNNCHFIGLSIASGRGDDGSAAYTLGDLFGSFENCAFNGCTAEGLALSVADPEGLALALFELPVPSPAPEETPAP